MTGYTTTETLHGELRIAEGTQLEFIPAENLPDNSLIKWWAVIPCNWPETFQSYSRTRGFGFYANDVRPLNQFQPPPTLEA